MRKRLSLLILACVAYCSTHAQDRIVPTQGEAIDCSITYFSDKITELFYAQVAESGETLTKFIPVSDVAYIYIGGSEMIPGQRYYMSDYRKWKELRPSGVRFRPTIKNRFHLSASLGHLFLNDLFSEWIIPRCNMTAGYTRYITDTFGIGVVGQMHMVDLAYDPGRVMFAAGPMASGRFFNNNRNRFFTVDLSVAINAERLYDRISTVSFASLGVGQEILLSKKRTPALFWSVNLTLPIMHLDSPIEEPVTFPENTQISSFDRSKIYCSPYINLVLGFKLGR